MEAISSPSHFNYQDYIPTDGIQCPICNISTSSLQALNRHLDTQHNEEDSKGALLSWLKNAQKKMQFKSSPTTTTTTQPTDRFKQWIDQPMFINSLQNLSLSNHPSPSFFVSDTDKQSDLVTRDHWQRETNHDPCQVAGCQSIVGKGGAGKQHCRKCGRLCCDAHTQYEIRLNRKAQHDPEHGIWSKVCVECFVSREGYTDHQGVTSSKTALFLKTREKTIDRVHLTSNRLEKRLEKLAKIHHTTDLHQKKPSSLQPPSLLTHSSSSTLSLERSDSTSSRDSLGSMLSAKSSFVSNSNSILSMKLKYRDGEQSVIKWEDDRLVKACPLCQTPFTLINRKHHCRLCGKVVCGHTRCSKMIPLFTDMSLDTFDDEPVGDTRACRDCQRYVFRRKLKQEEASKPLPIIQLYQQLAITRNKIEKLLPLFHQTILMLEKEKIKTHTHESFVKAAKIRKSLLDNFSLYDTLAKSIQSLPARSACMKRLQANICSAAQMYLQQNMLPLQMLPRILKTSTNQQKNPQQRQLESQLETYREQYSLIKGFIQEANADRKYDDVKTLQFSLEELDQEIKRIKALLRQ